MRNLLWRLVAFIVTRPTVTAWLITRAHRTPYFHITSQDGSSIYMGRWWLFNAYGRGPDGESLPARWPWLPSVRVHHIIRPDSDRHLHDHPWNARTIVLDGCYTEERPTSGMPRDELLHAGGFVLPPNEPKRAIFHRRAGYTGRLIFGQYHRISTVSEGGVWTMFWTWRKQGTWGFDVDGVKVPWREYLNENTPSTKDASQP